MLLGLVMLTAAWGLTQNGWVICYAWSLFIYGIGVGKESTAILLHHFLTPNRWRVPNDCHQWHGERRWLWEGFHQRGSPSPW